MESMEELLGSHPFFAGLGAEAVVTAVMYQRLESARIRLLDLYGPEPRTTAI
jgi:hypothetical protein